MRFLAYILSTIIARPTDRLAPGCAFNPPDAGYIWLILRLRYASAIAFSTGYTGYFSVMI
jgi:hypothetical protein